MDDCFVLVICSIEELKMKKSETTRSRAEASARFARGTIRDVQTVIVDGTPILYF